MPQKMKDVVLFGLESTRGTAAATFPLHQPYVSPGLVPTLTDHLGHVMGSQTWPYRTDSVPLGVTAALGFSPEVNTGTVRDLILMATKRTNGDQPAVSIVHGRSGVGVARYLGSVVESLELSYQSSGSPDAAALLSAQMAFACMLPEAAGVDTPGTQANGRRFRIGAATFTINAVAALEVMSYTRRITITHAMGRPDNANKRIYLEDGDVDDEVRLVARFTTAAWSNLVLGKTEHAASIVHATGTANETVTETMGKVQLESHTLGESEGTTTEEIVLRPFHTGAAAPTVWAFGSAIPATVLGL